MAWLGEPMRVMGSGCATIRRWLGSPFRRAVQAQVAAAAPQDFSLHRLAQENPGLAGYYRWGTNPLPVAPGPLYLHLGCGERVLDGFVNLDFIPHDARVLAWNLLDIWPDALAGTVAGVFSEDVLEHFFHGEQAYILCNVNRALQPGGTARTLMPSLARLVAYSADFETGGDDLLRRSFGVETGGDALNTGLRFSGHRWLHDPRSLELLAERCGFVAVPTACATSTVERFNGLNLRDETDSLSFATDLRKERPVGCVRATPQSVSGARHVEDLDGGAALYVATAARPSVEYGFAHPVATSSVACINIRSSNLSSFCEHNLKSLVVDDVNRDRPWYFDETLKSRSCMNIVVAGQLRLIVGDARAFSRLSFSPGARAGEYFTVGCAEVFALGQP